MQKIYIYNDRGTSKESLRQTSNTFKKYHPIQHINAEELKSKHWEDDCAIFIMPGGADLPYTRSLNGAGNLKIGEYLKGGGRYLGICAGAYYASGRMDFRKDIEITGERDLKFFPGKAVGPVFNCYSHSDNSGAIVAEVDMVDIGRLGVFFNGGCYFEQPEKYNGIDIIGRYTENNLPAIIKAKNFVLSGVHFEYDPTTFTSDDILHVRERLMDHEAKRKKLVDYIIDILK